MKLQLGQMLAVRRCTPRLALAIVAAIVFVLSQPRPSPRLNGDPMEARVDRGEKFVVASNSCHIVDVDPFDKSVLPFLRPEPPIVCSRRPPLTYITQLEVHEQMLMYRVGPRVPIEGLSARLQPEEEFIVVRCTVPRLYIYTNMHALVPTAKASAVRAAAAARTRPDPTEDPPAKRLSVLLVGIDSISYLSLHRTMPRMVDFLKRLGFVGLRGYNKVGDSTLPNLVAALAGLTMTQLEDLCRPHSKSPLDNCPFIWKGFAQRGYVTAFMEDTPDLSTFRRGGFIAQPTDFYLRPYILAAEALLTQKKRAGLSVCLGPISTTDHVLSYAEAFLDSTRGFPFFALIWLNNVGHNDLNMPAAMDVRFRRFFDDLAASPILNDSLVVFFSDHGVRYGDIRKTFVGWLEERLPFFFVSLPEWFRRKYPEAQTSLEANVARLTSPFDVYATLAGLAAGDAAAWGAVKVPGCPACRSLLAGPLPDRTCAEVGVDAEWCTCAAHEWPLPIKSAVVQRAAKAALGAVSAKLRFAPVGRCATLVLQKVVAARSTREVEGEGEDIVVVFETTPGRARFEATVRHSKPNVHPIVLGTVSRINSYAGQSDCVADAELKLYCFCK